jgi:hypothetical protein
VAGGGLLIQRIRFRQSGGFAGLTRECEVEAADLTSEERDALERRVRRRPAADEVTARTSPEARDVLGYALAIETTTGPVRLEFDELNVPPDLAGLVRSLSARCRPARP